VDAIRDEGSENIIVVPGPRIGDLTFRIVDDNIKNLAYDFHYYDPLSFTHQETEATNYPTLLFHNYLGNTVSTGSSSYYSGSNDWQSWTTKIPKLEMEGKKPSHIQPYCFSYANTEDISFDNLGLAIDGKPIEIYNSNLETGFGEFPDGWTQHGNNEEQDKALWLKETSGNHYISIPPVPENKYRAINPDFAHLLPLPDTYDEITLSVMVKGNNSDFHNILGVYWYSAELFYRYNLENDLKKFIDFGKNNNVPVMCLEFGVTMKATEEQGHLQYLKDYTDILESNKIHWAYHSYRNIGTGEDISLGIYQCWGKLASECENKFEFVLPLLKGLYGT